MAAPIVLISSCCEFDANFIVTGILGVEALPSPTPSPVPEMICYPWSLDTKYYTANVQLCVAKAKTIGDRQFASQVQAVLLYFDSTPHSFDLVKSWLPFVKEIDPEVKLLITERCADTGRNECMEWCVEYGFELVETDPDVDEEDDDDFAEPRGYKRVISALHAHTWPNLKLKNNSTNFRNPYMRTLLQEAEGATAAEPCDEKGAQEEKESETKNKQDKDGDISELLEALGNEDPGDESFEALFERMKLMKEKAVKMPESERKAYAEKIAMQFMKAMGCEDDLGFSSDDDQA